MIPETRTGEHDNLPAVPDDDREDVIEGVVVDQGQRVTVDLRRVGRVARRAATHKATRHTALHLGYIPLGVYATARAVYLHRSTREYSRQIAYHTANGDSKTALAWEQAKQTHLKARHDRRMQRRETALKTVAASPYIAGGFAGLLIAIGAALGIANHNIKDVAEPIMVTAEVIRGIVIVVSIAWGPLVLAAPYLAIAALWYTGRRFASSAAAPRWLQTSMSGDDLVIDESTIAQALKALGIPQVNEYLKKGLPLQFVTPARQEGRGTHFIVRLPAGVTAEKIAAKRPQVASGLHRQAKEVFLTTGGEAGLLNGWIADKGALEGGAGPYPLLTEGTADFFKGVPFGKTLKGDQIPAPMASRNTIVGGMPGQGKSSAARAIMAGMALDPRAELRVYVPDFNFDFNAFEPRCSRFLMGDDDRTIEAIRGELAELKAEIQTRGALLIEHEIAEVTSKTASLPGLHPVAVLLEEAHVAIQHPEFGDEIAQLLIDIVRLGRKRAIHVLVSTQAPTSTSMPRDVTRNCSNGIAFAVGDHVANDALLGQGAYKGGHRATELIPDVDKGTALVKGFSGERSEIVQVYFISTDQTAAIVKRAMANLKDRPVPGSGRRTAADSRDLLADIAQVVTTDRIRLADLPALLRDLAPSYDAYKTLTGTQVRKVLEDHGVRVLNPGNVPTLARADLTAGVS